MVLPRLERDACVSFESSVCFFAFYRLIFRQGIARLHHLVEGLLSWPCSEA
jgi:hypothetical protein